LPTTGGQDNCTVEVADGVTLRLINVTIPSTDKRLIFEGGPTSQLYIQRSNIRACDSDMFGFQHMVISTSTVSDPAGDDAGCDVKEMYITGDAEITRPCPGWWCRRSRGAFGVAQRAAVARAAIAGPR
jgi:hypothetical protein